MANQSFRISLQLQDLIQDTVGILPDYTETTLADLNIDTWQAEMLQLLADKLNESAVTLKEKQSQAIVLEITKLQYKLRQLHGEPEEDTAIVVTTPQVIEEKKRKGELPSEDDDSAIITTKSPRELKSEKDKSFNMYMETLK